MVASEMNASGCRCIRGGTAAAGGSVRADAFEAGAIIAGKDASVDAWAALLPAEARAKPPRVSVWQGPADYHGAEATATTTETVGAATRRRGDARDVR